jgi:hypothetical protein
MEPALQATTGSVDDFIESYPPDSRRIIEKLREIIKAEMPGTQETVYHGALGYSPTGQPYDRIVYVMPAKKHITLGFFFGTHLKDPKGLLTGEGSRMRHVKVRTVEEAGDPALRGLVKDANADAPKSLELLHKKWQAA